MTKPHITMPRNQNDGLQAEISKLTSISEFEPTLTQQNMAADCDINNILTRWTQTGVLPNQTSAPRYGDFSHIADFHASMNTVIAAQEMFNALDAKTRARFGNDPGALVDFLMDSDNKDEAIKLGLVNAPSEDLSTPDERDPTSLAKAGVGKSAPRAKPSQKSSNDDLGGDLGDD